MGKALSGELSCSCDRSCYIVNDHYLRAWLLCEGVWGEGEQRREISSPCFFLSTSGPISNWHYVTNLTLKCVCINNKKRKLLYPFYHGLSCDLEQKMK